MTPQGTINYTYDNASRRETMQVAGQSQAAYTFDNANRLTGTFNVDNAISGFNGTTFGYDANGNLTSDGTNTYTWDARNHLTAISGGATASFTYDAFGRRMKKVVAGTTTQFLYDRVNPVQELDSSNGVVANLVTGLKTDEFFARTDSSNNVSTLLTDALGSTIGLLGSAQSIATSYTYQPFGATTVGGGANGNSYQFTGRENDGSGLYFYRARYYSPTSQRFTSQDPIGFGGGSSNLYGYVRNDPINKVDRLGLWDPQCEELQKDIQQLLNRQSSCSNPAEQKQISNELAQLQQMWDLFGCDEGPPPDGDGGDEVPGEDDNPGYKEVAQPAEGVGLAALLWQLLGPVEEPGLIPIF